MNNPQNRLTDRELEKDGLITIYKQTKEEPAHDMDG